MVFFWVRIVDLTINWIGMNIRGERFTFVALRGCSMGA